MLSGVPCVGKTTAAYNIVKRFPEFRRVSELDIIRTVVRAVIHSLEDSFIDKNAIQKQYLALFDSLSESNLDVAKEQSKLLIPYIKEIVVRQQMRKIPTVIEGSSIVPSTYFINNIPIDGFKDHVLFINLYLSNEHVHINRRMTRCYEREYDDNMEQIIDKVTHVREGKNFEIHKETLELSMRANNVFSFDVTNMTPDDIVSMIIIITQKYLKNT